MWKSCILAGPKNIEIKSQSSIFKKLKTELLSSVSGLRVNCTLTEPGEKAAVEVLIGRLLDAGKLDTALRIGAIFNQRNRVSAFLEDITFVSHMSVLKSYILQELQVLMLCLSLAEGEISPYQLTIQQKSLLTEFDKPKHRNYTLRGLGLQRLPSAASRMNKCLILQYQFKNYIP